MMSSRIDYDAFRNAKYFPALDGMRSLCVFLVMFNHVKTVSIPSWIYGSLGVDVFFVLSGFLITTLLVREKERTGSVTLKGFYTRRFFRIIPVYLFTVLLYFLAVRATHDSVKTTQFNVALPWLLSFMQEYRPESSGNILGHAWTLGIEEKFYIFWPLLLLALYPFRARAWLCLGAIFVALLFSPYLYSRSYGGLLIGAVLGIALSVAGRWNKFKALSAIPDSLLCLLVVGAYVLHGHSNAYVLLFSGTVALLVSSLVLRTGFVRRFLEAPILIFIGKRSYAMYLIHVLVLNVVEDVLPKLLAPNWYLVIGTSYVLTIAAASLMHVTIERPCIAFGRKLSKRWSQHARTPVVCTGA
jgi:peptidoglycan/LPS O-acetylase OafA/YrhL